MLKLRRFPNSVARRRPIAAHVVAAHGACRVITNLGAYQDSPHLHWHVVAGDRLPPAWLYD